MKKISIIVLVLISMCSFAQTEKLDTIKEVEKVQFKRVEIAPGFPGGDAARIKYISENIVYPATAKEQGVGGRVYVTFIVEADGKITNAQVLRGLGYGLDEEALRVVKSMPDWSPGKMEDGTAVRVQFNMPIHFIMKVEPAEKEKKKGKRSKKKS